MFEESYKKSTGTAWSRQLFERRAKGWIFYGNPHEKGGVVAIRKQRSGMNKLVSVAGRPLSIRSAVKLMLSDMGDEPIWGLISSEMVPLAEKVMNLMSAPSFVKKVVSSHPLKAILPVDKMVQIFINVVVKSIPSSVFGSSSVKVLKDGGVEVEIAQIGKITKYLVANEQYYRTVLSSGPIMNKIKETNKIAGSMIEKFFNI